MTLLDKCSLFVCLFVCFSLWHLLFNQEAGKGHIKGLFNCNNFNHVLFKNIIRISSFVLRRIKKGLKQHYRVNKWWQNLDFGWTILLSYSSNHCTAQWSNRTTVPHKRAHIVHHICVAADERDLFNHNPLHDRTLCVTDHSSRPENQNIWNLLQSSFHSHSQKVRFQVQYGFELWKRVYVPIFQLQDTLKKAVWQTSSKG